MAERDYAKIFPRVKETSPFYQLLGIEEVEVREGYASLRMEFRPQLTHSYGIVHGGAMTALIDSTGAVALLTRVRRGETVTTIELKVNFLASVAAGRMTAEAVIVHHGRRTAVIDCTVTRGDGKKVAKALLTYMILQPEAAAG
ncbi:MAG: PaaI family thioesterase [Candidatus Tectomicrobia bacterium]|nr:PaaI family thioesterase [Candidatus Tectomicrobia bacterium]